MPIKSLSRDKPTDWNNGATPTVSNQLRPVYLLFGGNWRNSGERRVYPSRIGLVISWRALEL